MSEPKDTPVTCGSCQARFQKAWDEEPLRGWGCAATAKGGSITCFYGSRMFDGDTYSAPGVPDSEHLCDICLAALIVTGEASFVSSCFGAKAPAISIHHNPGACETDPYAWGGRSGAAACPACAKVWRHHCRGEWGTVCQIHNFGPACKVGLMPPGSCLIPEERPSCHGVAAEGSCRAGFYWGTSEPVAAF